MRSGRFLSCAGSSWVYLSGVGFAGRLPTPASPSPEANPPQAEAALRDDPRSSLAVGSGHHVRSGHRGLLTPHPEGRPNDSLRRVGDFLRRGWPTEHAQLSERVRCCLHPFIPAMSEDNCASERNHAGVSLTMLWRATRRREVRNSLPMDGHGGGCWR